MLSFFVMIEISRDYILYEGVVEGKVADFLWECLQVVGKRFVGVVTNFTERKISYDEDYEITRKNNFGIGIFKINDFSEFKKFLEIAQNSLRDYYIVINSLFSEVKENILSGNYVSNESFNNELFLRDFPRTFYVYTDKLFIDMDEFKSYDFQLKRVAERFSKKL